MQLPFFTIGHSNRSLEDFVELLLDHGVQHLADVRKLPISRANPQFNKSTLPDALAARQISYEHMATLGGLRGKTRNLSRDINGFWTNESFHSYADYALSPEFLAGFDQLLARGHERHCVIMCSEAVWWRCHRRIIADYLIGSGETVFHIMGRSRLEPARLTPGAIIQPGGTVVYPVTHDPIQK